MVNFPHPEAEPGSCTTLEDFDHDGTQLKLWSLMLFIFLAVKFYNVSVTQLDLDGEFSTY